MDPAIGEPIQEGRKSRKYCFTVNNYTEEDRASILSWMKEAEYGIVAREVGDKCGTPHLQCFVIFKNARHPLAVRKLPGMARSAIYVCKGNTEQNVKYCRKGGDFEEVNLENLKMKDYTAMSDHAKKLVELGPKYLREMVKSDPKSIVLHYRGYMSLLGLAAPDRTLSSPPRCVWAFGPAGSGKSTFTKRLADEVKASRDENVYYFGNQFPWADGYIDEKIIVVDDVRDHDFRKNPIPINFMTRMIDVFPMMLQTKGGSCKFYGDTFFFSSVSHPGDMWNNNPLDPVTQILRRITELYECKKNPDGSFTQTLLGDGLTPRAAMLISN